MEYLLGSRTVLSAITTVLNLRAFTLITPFLLLLWALSPIGGQAGLRVVSTVSAYSNKSAEFSFVDFMSSFNLQGPDVELNSGAYTAINAAFATALMSAATTRDSGQDSFGNIKVPLLEAVPDRTKADESSWISLEAEEPVVYSSLAGLRTIGISGPGTSHFKMETSYIYTNCSLSHQDNVPMLRIQNMSYEPSGGNWGISEGPNMRLVQNETHIPAWVVFKSFSYSNSSSPNHGTITSANCSLTQTYVEIRL